MRPQHVRQLAAELELVSHGAVANWSPSGRSVPDSRTPSGEPHPPHLQFLADWDRKGESAVTHWRTELFRWRGHGQRREPSSTEADWIIEDGKGQAPDDVARRFRCTPTRVRRLRREADVNEETGVGETMAARARAMKDSGMSVRSIALALGEHPTQVQRWVGKQAA